MNRFGHYREGWFNNGWQPFFWLLPLVIGLGLGALLFAPLHNIGAWADGRPHSGYGRGEAQGFHEQRVGRGPQANIVPPAPETGAIAERGFGGPRGDHGIHGGGFWPFGLGWPFSSLRLLAPLLLMGAGAWLLLRRPHGLSWGGPEQPQRSQPGNTYSPPSAPAEPHHPDDIDPIPSERRM